MTEKTLTGVLLDEHVELSLTEISRTCATSTEWIIALVEEGAIEPEGTEPAEWRFAGSSVQRVQTAIRLQRDLDINAAGVALALELLEEIETLRARLAVFEP
jgi:chaperone modulatory protein CbpM